MFIVKHRCLDIVIDKFETFNEATECVENLENCDKENDEFEPSAYVIVEG